MPLLVVAVTACAGGRAPAADQFDAVRDLIRRRLEQGEAPSIAVAVVRGDRVVREEGFGWADQERRRTATAVMVARERRLLDLDRPVNDYLGEAKVRAGTGRPSDATARRVIQHMAG